MNGSELLHSLEKQRGAQHHFMKWWREDKDVPTIELLDTFLDRAKVGDQFSGFKLLDMEEMWEIVRQRCAGRAERAVCNNKEVLVWERAAQTGGPQRVTSLFSPESLIKVFDLETEGDNND
jgi:hypothetical protein